MALTRRQYLVAAAAVGLGGGSGVASASSAAECTDLLERLEALESGSDGSETGTAGASIEELHRRIVELHAERTPGQDFPDGVRSAALDVATALRESVVVLDARTGPGGGSATAWYVEEDLLLTNAHNVDPADERLGCVALDGTAVDVEVVGFDEDHDPDVALLRASVPGPPVTLGDSTALSEGDPLVHVGHPHGFGYWVNTVGRYNHRVEGIESDVLYTTVPSLAGSSGSPVADLNGRIVGLLFGGTNRSGNRVGTVPEPADTTVRQGLLPPDTWTLLVPVEDVRDRMEAWR